MGNAVIVKDAYKKFGKPGEPLWKRLLQGKGAVQSNQDQNDKWKQQWKWQRKWQWERTASFNGSENTREW